MMTLVLMVIVSACVITIFSNLRIFIVNLHSPDEKIPHFIHPEKLTAHLTFQTARHPSFFWYK